MFGVAMYAVVGVAEADDETLQELAKLLGEKISPDSPLAKHIAQLVNEHAGAKYAGPAGQSAKKLDSLVVAPAAIEPMNPGSATDWIVLPFPANSDWPGPKGFAAVLGGGDFLLRGQPVRTRQSYSVPVHITFDVVLEERFAPDGSMQVIFDPADVPDDLQGEQNIDAQMCYRNRGAYSGTDGILVNELLSLGENFHPQSRIIWPEKPFQLNAGETYHVSLVVTARGMQWTINGETHDLTGVKVPFDKFRITLYGWQPTDRWHVRNVSVN
jgi:hypothetical protein